MSNFILAFAGRKQSGKTTCAQFVGEVFAKHTMKKYDIYNFADPLKQDICINILGLTYDQCYGSDDQKNELVDCYWDNKKLSAREVMQIVGTDMFRKLQTNVWSEATIRKIKKDNPKLGIIADCRFPNEVEAIKNAGGLVIKLTRNPYNSDHSSEMALDENNYDHSKFDIVVDNKHMTIQQQNAILLDFLKHKGLLQL
jgi:cytidylate kinase